MKEFRVESDTLTIRRRLRRNIVNLWLAIAGLLCVIMLALFVPRVIDLSANGRTDTLTRLSDWIVPLILLVVVVGCYLLAARLGRERARLKTVYSLTDEALFRRREGWPEERFGLSEVKSITQKRHCLVVEIAEPPSVIAISNEIEGFAILREELEKHCKITDSSRPSNAKVAPVVAICVCWALVLLSNNHGIVKLASVAGLVVLSYSSYRLAGVALRGGSVRAPLWTVIGLGWIAALLTVYLRVFLP